MIVWTTFERKKVNDIRERPERAPQSFSKRCADTRSKRVRGRIKVVATTAETAARKTIPLSYSTFRIDRPFVAGPSRRRVVYLWPLHCRTSSPPPRPLHGLPSLPRSREHHPPPPPPDADNGLFGRHRTFKRRDIKINQLISYSRRISTDLGIVFHKQYITGLLRSSYSAFRHGRPALRN